MKKIICPNCKGENLEYFEESIYTRYYKLNKYNEPTKTVKRRHDDGTNGCFNWECMDCGEVFGGSSPIPYETKDVEE